MKTSSGLLLGVLFTLVVVIVALVIYFNTRPEEEEKPETSTGPSPTLPSISDLTVSQILSPNSDSETYTIEPYTIEYAEGDNEKSLSKNVTFTLNWRNEGSFDDVTTVKVEHHIKIGEVTTLMSTRTSSLAAYRSSFTDVSFPVRGLADDPVDATNAEKKQYSFVGKSRFKITAVLNRNVTGSTTEFQSVTLYDGVDLGETDPSELEIKAEDLTATIDMAQALEKTYSLQLRTDADNDAGKTQTSVKNQKYKFVAKQLDGTNGVIYENIELISQDDTGKKFKFRSGTTYWGTTNVTPTTPGAKPYEILTTTANRTNAVVITFVNSSLDCPEVNDNNCPAKVNYKSFKIVKGTEDDSKDLYLHGIKSKVAFREISDTIVNESPQLSHTRHWLITKQ